MDFDKIMAEIKAETLMDAPAEEFRLEPDILPIFDKKEAAASKETPFSHEPMWIDTKQIKRNNLSHAEEKSTLPKAMPKAEPEKTAPAQPKTPSGRRLKMPMEEEQKREHKHELMETPKQKREPREKKTPKKKKRTKLGIAFRILLVLWILLLLYFIAAFSDIPFIANLRTTYIQTALETMSHDWLARWFFPPSVVDPIAEQRDARQNEDLQSSDDWGKEPPDVIPVDPSGLTVPTEPPKETTPEDAFYTLFWEIDRPTMEVYLASHPEALKDGWENININEAGLDDDGTVIYTTMGEQVLAINVPDRILLVRVAGFGYRGVLAVAKDPSRLHNYASANIGSSGQYAGTIARNNGGILAINSSGFMDDGGIGNGGSLAGFTMADGVSYGKHAQSGYKRIELHEDNRMYIKDAGSAVGAGTTDASEFTPALIIDGVTVVNEYDFWNGVNPRACIGQSENYEILMLVIEGRNILDGVTGTGVVECAEIFARHKCMQAMNLDGGATAIMWYDGEYVTHCSNGSLEGRLLPAAWVYTEID